MMDSGTTTPTMKIAPRPVIVAIQVRRLDGCLIEAEVQKYVERLRARYGKRVEGGL